MPVFRLLHWLLPLALASSAVCGCSAAPEPSHTSSALEPSQDLPPTGYTFTLSKLKANNIYDASGLKRTPHDDDLWTEDSGVFTDWAQLSVRRNIESADMASGVLGQFVTGTVLSTCTAGCSGGIGGQPLSVYVKVASPNDVVHFGIALDNIASVNPSAVASNLGNVIGGTGDLLQGAGGIIAVVSGGTGVGAVVGGIIAGVGSAMAVIGDLWGPPQVKPEEMAKYVTCAGGLIYDKDATGTKDTMFVTFTPDQLAQLTANGPISVDYRVTRNDSGSGYTNYCVSDHTITITISRDWSGGLAPQSRSGNGAVARGGGEMDAFFIHKMGNSPLSNIERRYWSNGAWMTDSVQDVNLLPSASVASISPTPDALEAYWVDETGWLQGNIWQGHAATYWKNLAYKLPAHAGVAPTARMPNKRDLFYMDGTGTLNTMYWTGGPISRSQFAIASSTRLGGLGGAVAAVARSAYNLDAFFIGANGALYNSYWYDGIPEWGTRVVSVPRVAPVGGALTAVARTTQNLDVFFAGFDPSGQGVVYQSQWNSTINDWATTPIAVSRGLVTAGASIQAISIASGQFNIVVAGSDHRLYWLQSQASSNVWSIQPITPAGSTAIGNISFAARTPTIWNVFYTDGNGNAQGLDFHYIDQSWYPFAVPFANTRIGGIFPFGGLDHSLCIDTTGGGQVTSGARILTAKCSGRTSQRFAFSTDGHIVSAVDPNLCMDVSGAPSMLPCGSSNGQIWEFTNGRLMNAGRCFDVYYASHTPGTLLDIDADCNGTMAQQFMPFNIPFEIHTTQQGQYYNQCLDLFTGLFPFGTYLDTQTCNGSATQTFQMDDHGRLAAASGCVDGVNNGNGGVLSVDACGTQWTQLWFFDGAHLQTVKPWQSFLTGNNIPGCLDLYYNGQGLGTNADYTSCNGTQAQVFAVMDFVGNWPFAPSPL